MAPIDLLFLGANSTPFLSRMNVAASQNRFALTMISDNAQT